MKLANSSTLRSSLPIWPGISLAKITISAGFFLLFALIVFQQPVDVDNDDMLALEVVAMTGSLTILIAWLSLLGIVFRDTLESA